MSSPFIVHHLEAMTSGPITDVLEQQIHMPKSTSTALLHHGSIWANYVRVRENVQVEKGQYLRVHAQPRRFPVESINWKNTILHEEPDFLVINKPAGIPVHPTVDNWTENLLYCLEEFLKHPVLITQRLDTATAGLLILAKTKWFQAQFNKLLRERSLTKTYHALAKNPVATGEVLHYMKDTPHAPKQVFDEPFDGALECRLIVRKCEPYESNYLLEIELLTGRTHQIRAQLAALGTPILGDKIYGSEASNPWQPQNYIAPEAIALRAYSLAFQHPATLINHEFKVAFLT